MVKRRNGDSQDFTPLRGSWLSRHSGDLLQLGFFLLTFAAAVGTTYLSIRMQIQAIELHLEADRTAIAELRESATSTGRSQAATHEDVAKLSQHVDDIAQRLLDKIEANHISVQPASRPKINHMEITNEEAAALLSLSGLTAARGRGAANIRTGDR